MESHTILDFRLKKATPLINPRACDRDSEFFFRSTNESEGPELNCLIVNKGDRSFRNQCLEC